MQDLLVKHLVGFVARRSRLFRDGALIPSDALGCEFGRSLWHSIKLLHHSLIGPGNIANTTPRLAFVELAIEQHHITLILDLVFVVVNFKARGECSVKFTEHVAAMLPVDTKSPITKQRR